MFRLLRLGVLCAIAAGAMGQPATAPVGPQPPTITPIAAPLDLKAPPRIPTVNFANDVVITSWLCSTAGKNGQKLAQLLSDADPKAAQELLANWQPIAPDNIAAQSYPDFTDAIDLWSLGGRRDGASITLCAILDVDKARLVRVCIGAVGDGVEAGSRMWIAGQPLVHGGLARLAPGRHPIVIETTSGRRQYAWQWPGRRLAPRFTQVTEDEIQAVHQWRVGLWKEQLDAAQADPTQLLAHVTFDPKTVRGAEGFFRVGRSTNGKWWFIDPDGKPWYQLGVCGLNQGAMGGRRGNKQPVDEARVAQWLGILKDWRFNALGSWSTPEFFEKGLAHTDIIEGYYVGPYVHGGPYGPGIIPDVFDPKWEENLDAKCRDICAPQAKSKLLVGYYLDNERGFRETLRQGVSIVAKSPTFVAGGIQAIDQVVVEAEPARDAAALGLLQYCLSFADTRPPAHAKAAEFALSRHNNNWADVGKAWGVPLESAKSIMQLTARGERLISEGYLADEEAFVELWVEQYYRVFAQCIRRHDPNHLMLGMRHGGTPGPAVLRAEARHAHVISRNCYRAEFHEAMDSMYEPTGRPILNGEYPEGGDTFNGVRNPIEPPGGLGRWERNELRQRTSIDRLFSHPGVVGYTFYKWKGQPPQIARVRWLTEANQRALAIAAAWDRAPLAAQKPLNGQVFVTLATGWATTRNLPSPDPKAQPSLMIERGPIHLGLVCRDGQWDEKVWGNGIRGQIVALQSDRVRCRLGISIEAIPGMFTSARGQAQYQIDLVRNDTQLEGTFSGTSNDQKVTGRAIGYLYRPVATVNY